LSFCSGERLEGRVQQREDPQRAERTKTNQSESPEWPRVRRCHRRKSCRHQRFSYARSCWV